tara:strand:+ start:334 stop:603 length:270 start_codon:yes stop_codon:yes gene_type:complete
MVIEKKPCSHIKYWKPFTKYIIKYINDNCENIIFIVYGAFALEMIKYVDNNKHDIYISSHPSSLSVNKKLKYNLSFNDSNVFNKIKSID